MNALRLCTLFFILFCGAVPAFSQVVVGDTISSTVPIDTIKVDKKHSPRKATMLAAVFPGAGQFYNRQYIKIPFVYAGGVTFVLLIKYYNNFYLQYVDALTQYNLNPDQLAEPYKSIYLRNPSNFKNNVVNAIDQSRRYRDLNIILSIVFYTLTIADANVSAHLKTFDLSDNLSLRIKPFSSTTVYAYQTPSLGLTLQFTLK